MFLKGRVERLEKQSNPKEKIKIVASVWDEAISGPWPRTEGEKRKIEAERGCKIFWVEAEPKPGQRKIFK